MPSAINDVYAITAFCRLFGQRVMNTLHYTTATISAIADQVILQDLLNQVRGGIGGAGVLEGEYMALFPSTYVLERWRVQKIRPTRTAFMEYTRNVSGTFVGTIETANIAASITKRTVLAGRKYIGRCQLVGPPNEGMNGGLVDTGSAWYTAFSNWGAAMKSTLTDSGTGVYAPCIHHKDPADPPTAWITSEPQLTVRTMHRRTLGLGE